MDTCDEGRASVVALPVMPQLRHGGILTDVAKGVFLDDLADRLSE